MSGTEMVIQPTTFRDSSTIATFINIILGILLGGAIVWFLVVPANRQAVNDEANRQVTDANTKLGDRVGQGTGAAGRDRRLRRAGRAGR